LRAPRSRLAKGPPRRRMGLPREPRDARGGIRPLRREQIEAAPAQREDAPRSLRREPRAVARGGQRSSRPRTTSPGVPSGGPGDDEHLPARAPPLLAKGRSGAPPAGPRARRDPRRGPRRHPPQVAALRADRGGPRPPDDPP